VKLSGWPPAVPAPSRTTRVATWPEMPTEASEPGPGTSVRVQGPVAVDAANGSLNRALTRSSLPLPSVSSARNDTSVGATVSSV
jgi:hypothetical protein